MTQKELLDCAHMRIEMLRVQQEEQMGVIQMHGGDIKELFDRTKRLLDASGNLALGQAELRRMVTETRWLRIRRWFAQWIYSGPEVAQ